MCHIFVLLGGDEAEIYRNRKGYFSLNTQIISDADLKITNIVARWPGATHDSTIFNNSGIKQAFDRNDFPNCLLLGKETSLIIKEVSIKNIK